jgi:hypothetical protein
MIPVQGEKKKKNWSVATALLLQWNSQEYEKKEKEISDCT